MWKVLIAALRLSMIADNADAADSGVFTVQDLYNWCKAGDNDSTRLMCIGYVSGVMDVMAVVGTDHGETTSKYGMCITERVSYQAAIQTFINWAEKNPKVWNQPRDIGVIVALKEL